MAKRKIDKSDGHYLAGTEVIIDSELNFVTTSNPEITTTGGSFVWKIITAITTAWKFRDDTKGQDIITIDTDADIVTANNTDYSFIGFDSNKITSVDKSATYTAQAWEFIKVTTGAGNIPINLPPVASSTDIMIRIMKVDVGGGNIDVTGDGIETINGVNIKTITSQWSNMVLFCDGIAWFIQ